MLKRLTPFIATIWLVLTILAVIQPRAQLMVNELNGFNVASVSGPASITFLQCTDDTTDQTTYSFAGVNTGTASSDRALLFSIVSRDSANTFSIASASVDSNAAAELADTNQGDVVAGLYIIALPTGTSSTISVTMSEPVQTVGICAWQVNNLQSLTAVDVTMVNNGTSGNSINLNINTLADGVGAGVCATGATSGTYTWSGLTERADRQVAPSGGGSLWESVASSAFTTSETPRSVICDPTASGDSNVGISLSLR